MDIIYDKLLSLTAKMSERGYVPNKWDYFLNKDGRVNLKIQYASGNVVTYGLPFNFEVDDTLEGILNGDVEAVDVKTPFQLFTRRQRRQLQQRAGRPKRYSRSRYTRKKSRK
jgi:hypothetical protein